MTDSPSVAPAADTPSATLAQKLAAEALGTFLVVLIGCGSIIYLGLTAAISDSGLQGDVVAVALAFGFLLVGLGFVFGRVSGGHFNPVLSLGAALAGRLAWTEALLMAAAQLVGGILGGAVLVGLMKGYKPFDAFNFPIGASTWGDNGTGYAWWAAILLELVLSAVLVVVYLAATDRRNPHAAMAPLVIGVTFAALYFISLPAVGGGINPARSIGADLFSGSDAIKGVWVFIVGPLLGTAVGGFLYPAVFGRDADPVPGSGLNLGSGSTSTSGYPGYQQWGQAGGYPAAGQQAPAYGQSAPAEQPIIQDGWQWDPQTQQWIPAQQQPAPPAGGGESTQIRPPGV